MMSEDELLEKIEAFKNCKLVKKIRESGGIDVSYGIRAVVGAMIFFTGPGLAILIYALVDAYHSYEFLKYSEPVQATIDRIEHVPSLTTDGDYYVYVSYTFDGEEYSGITINEYSSFWHEGDVLTRYCQADDPTELHGRGFIFGKSILVGLFGLIFTVIGLPSVVCGIQDLINDKKSARDVWAVVDEITFNTHYSVNGRNPYLVLCSYTDPSTGTTYQFKSRNLWKDPGTVLAPGSSVSVHVRDTRFKRYTVDVKGAMEGRMSC